MQMPKTFFITSNPNKLKQVQDFISVPLIHKHLELPEIQSLNLQEIVKNKAHSAFHIVQKPVLVEDVSLIINYLGKLPGPFIKWFLKELGLDGICKISAGSLAIGEVCYGYYDGHVFQAFSGIIDGKIATSPAGEAGFGWDRIFIPKGYEVTRAQMNTEDFEKTSPRKMALEKLEKYLKRIQS